jgi:hypothetical protein
VGERLHQLARGDLAPRQEHHHRQPRGSAVSGERGAGVARRRAGHRLNRQALPHGLAHHADEHRHAQILERAAVAVAAQLHPQIAQPDLLAVALRPEQVGAALVHRDDQVVVHAGHDPFALAPDSGAVGPARALVALVEQRAPLVAGLGPQRLDVVLDLEQAPAGGAAVDGKGDGPVPITTGDA